jgi:hypothetical protein
MPFEDFGKPVNEPARHWNQLQRKGFQNAAAKRRNDTVHNLPELVEGAQAVGNPD